MAFSPLFIFGLDHKEPQALAGLARALGFPEAQLVAGSVEEGEAALRARVAQPPAYILIDIGGRGRDVLADLDVLALSCPASARVAVIGSINDIAFYRELRHRDIAEYFIHPVHPDDIHETLLVPVQESAVSSARGSVIAFMSAGSGDGASTLAANVAWCLAEGGQAVLVDMDYQFGLVARQLELSGTASLRDAFDCSERVMDAQLIDRMLLDYRHRLKVIAAPELLFRLPALKPDAVTSFIALLRARFGFVILDLPRLWADWVAAALSASDQVVLAAQLGVRSLTHASRLLRVWQDLDIPAHAVSLIINRHGAKFRDLVASEDFEHICRHAIDAALANDVRTALAAEREARTIMEGAEETLLKVQLAQLAQMLRKRCRGEALPEAVSGKRGWFAVFERKTG